MTFRIKNNLNKKKEDNAEARTHNLWTVSPMRSLRG